MYNNTAACLLRDASLPVLHLHLAEHTLPLPTARRYGTSLGGRTLNINEARPREERGASAGTTLVTTVDLPRTAHRRTAVLESNGRQVSIELIARP